MATSVAEILKENVKRPIFSPFLRHAWLKCEWAKYTPISILFFFEVMSIDFPKPNFLGNYQSSSFFSLHYLKCST